ncbi:unnamed protein product [Calypogeia fissa]
MTEIESKHTARPSKTVVTLSYADLKNESLDLSENLEVGFGPSGLGIIAITDVPGYPQLRKKLLPLAQRVATLPEDVRKQLEDPPSRYSFGWSHGKEKLETGRPDQLKGSFYANLCKDMRTTSTVLMERYPTQCRNNLWPKEHLPELESTMKELGSLIIEVGFLLAHHCDKYVSSRNPKAEVESLQKILRRSQCHKGRLLHYFPNFDSHGDDDLSSWCGWHRDIGSLTGLTCAMYTKGGVEVPSPDPEAGLYIENREGKVVKAVYNADYLAFQLGETTEILSGGLFHATPHCVKAPRQEILGVERNSFAVFMQPQWDEPLKLPQIDGESLNKVQGEYSNLRNFGDFSESKMLKYNYDPVHTVDVAT